MLDVVMELDVVALRRGFWVLDGVFGLGVTEDHLFQSQENKRRDLIGTLDFSTNQLLGHVLYGWVLS